MVTLPIIDELAKEAFNTPAFEEDQRFPPSKYYSFFYLFAKRFKPSLSVVSGVCGGGDCFHLAKGNPDGIVVGVDNKWDRPDNIKYIADSFQNFRFFYNDSIRCPRVIHDLYGKIDLLFIDSVHTYEETMGELLFYKPYLNKNAVVCFDDLHRESMKDVWDMLPNPKIRVDDLHQGGDEGGFGICLIGE